MSINNVSEKDVKEMMVGYRLSSGEYVIAKSLGIQEYVGMVLSIPMFIEIRNNSNGPAIGLVPASPYAADEFTIVNPNTVQFTFEPDPKLVDAYNTVIAKMMSKIAVPEKKLLLPN